MPMRVPKGRAASPSSPTTTTVAPPRSSTPKKPSATSSAPSGGNASSTSSAAAGGPQSQPIRDRIIALYAKYDPSFIPRTDNLVKRLGNDKKSQEEFIAEYVRRHGPEPPSKEAALREYFMKLYKGDVGSTESTMKLLKDAPSMEIQIFTELMHHDEREKQQKAASAPPSNATTGAKGPNAVPASNSTNNNNNPQQPGAATTGATSGKNMSVSGNKQPPSSPHNPQPTGKFPSATSAPVNGKAPAGNFNQNAKSTPANPQQQQQRAAGVPPPNENNNNNTAGRRSPNLSAAVPDMGDRNETAGFSAYNNGFNNSSNNNINFGNVSKEDAGIQTVMREKSTCDKRVRDRIVAMLACYDPDSLLQFDEDSDIPNTTVGNSFLNALMEQHGPEPVSKKEAFETLLRRLFEKQDPARLKSIKTLTAAAESSGREMQIIRALFNAYGLGLRAGKSLASHGLAPSGSFSSSSSYVVSSPLSALNTTTSTSILSPFTQMINGGLGGTAMWSPDRSVNAQRGLFDTSPRHLPIRTKDDLLQQLSSAPTVMNPSRVHSIPADHQQNFSDLLTLDTRQGPASLSSDIRMEAQLSGLSVFKKAARGEADRFDESMSSSTNPAAASYDPELDELVQLPESHTTDGSGVNPFLKGAGRAKNQELKGRAVMIEHPKTPPAVDLGRFGRL